MKFRSIDAFRVRADPPGLELRHAGRPVELAGEGAYCFIPLADDQSWADDAWLLVCMPPREPHGGSHMAISMLVTTDPAKEDRRGFEGTYWHWNGNQDKPTLRPSVGCGRHIEQWHGYLRDGRWEACE